MPDPIAPAEPTQRQNPLLGLKLATSESARVNPLMSIRMAPLEPRPSDLGGAVASGIQDIGRMGMALPALGEHAVGAIANLFGATVPEASTPFSNTLGDMARTDQAAEEVRQVGYAPPSLGTEVLEGGTRSVIGMLPGMALAPAGAAAGATTKAITTAAALPGAYSAAGNQLGGDLNDPTMDPAQRAMRSVLAGGLEFAGEKIPLGRLGLGPEAALARAIAGVRVPASAGRAVGSIAAESGAEFLTGGAQSVTNDLTDNETQTFGDVTDQALDQGGTSALTALPVSTAMATATEGLNAQRERQQAVADRNQQIATMMERAFSPDAAPVAVPAAEGPGFGVPADVPQADGAAPVEVTPEVIDAVRANPELLDLLKPQQIGEAIEADQQAVADAVSPGENVADQLADTLQRADGEVVIRKQVADDTKRGLAELNQADDEALRQQQVRQVIDNEIGEPRDTQAAIELEREQEQLAKPTVDVEAQKTLADQERVTRENQDRENRRTAFRVREDIRAAEEGNDVGTHAYDDSGKLTVDSERPNHFLSLPPEKRGKAIEYARKFVRHHLGDDEGAMAADDPTATPEVAKHRMESKPLPPEMAAGVKASTPSPEPTAAELVAMPAKDRLAAFSALPQESRLRLQPEVTRLIQDQKRIHGFNDNPTPVRGQRVPGQPGGRTKPAADALPAAQSAPQPGSVPPVPNRVEGQSGGQPAPTVGSSQPSVPSAGKLPAAAASSQPQPSTGSTPAPANPKEISRLARISKAVLPAGVTVDEQPDHVRITYPGGATIQVRSVDSVPIDPEAWFDSVAKVKGALSSAFSRAGYGPMNPPKAAFLRMPKAQREKVMAELSPVAAVTDISGKRVGLSREALVRLVTPGKRTDAEVANALEEEDHHFLFSGLLTNEERTIVRDELAKANPALAKEDPASRAVMEAAYEHWRTWNQDRQKAAVSPKVAGVFQKLIERIRSLLKWFDRTPTVSAKSAAQVWEGLGAARERTEVTPAKSDEAASDDANAVLIPRDKSLEGPDLQRQWDKATGQRKPKGESWQQLEERSAKVDRARKLQGNSPDDAITTHGDVPYRNGNVDFGDPRVVQITKEPDWDRKHVPESVLESGDEEGMWRAAARAQKKMQRETGIAYSVPQALNDIMPSEQAQSFAQWQKEADEILADDTRMADVRARALADINLSPAEQIALRRQVGEQLAEAATSGNQNRWIEAMESAALRKASGARVAREMAARRLDLSTPEGRRELMLNHVAEMGRRWQSAFNRAKTKRDRNAAAARWQKQQQRIFKTLKDRFGIDLTDPRVGEIFSDAYSVGQLLDTVSDVAGERFHFGRLVGYYVAGNLLGGAAVAANTTGYPLMMSMQAFKAVPSMIAKALMKSDNQNLTSAQGAWAAVHAGVKAIGRGIVNGGVSFWTGRPQANRQVDPTGGSEDDANRMVAPIKNPFARLALAPFLELNRFMDEMAWTIGYNGALAAVATERKQAGDQRSHRELIESPDADMIERAVRWADWFTLRGTGNKAADAALQKLSSVREASPKWLEDAVDSVAPGAGTFAVNPLYFVMPFFKTIAVLTVEGAKLATPPLMAAVAVKRGVDALRADTKEGKQEAGAAALKATAYTLAGLALMGLARLGDDEDPLVKGSPSDGKSSGERSTKFAVEEPRTIGGVDYSRLDPVAMPLSLHADFRDAMKDLQGGKPAGAVLNKLGEKAWNAAVQRQFLQGLDNLFRPQYDEEGQPKGMTEKFTESVSGQLAPGRPWISTARRLTETERMQRPKGEITRVYDAGRPARNTFGEREQTRDDTNVAAIAGLFFPPRGKASEEAQAWQKAIYDLNAEVEKTGGKTWWPNPIGRSYQSRGQTLRWTDDQYDRVRELAGRKWLSMLNAAKPLKNDAVTPERKLMVMESLREQANQWAKAQVRKTAPDER